MSALLQHPLLPALAMALVHSLWVFTALAGVSWLCNRALNSAADRYLGHLITLLSLPVIFLVVLVMEWYHRTGQTIELTILTADANGGPDSLVATAMEASTTAVPNWMLYVTAVYTLGLFMSATITTRRYLATRRMRRGGLLPSPDMRVLFERLRQQVAPGKKVIWKISERAGEVVLTGVLRPIILFPVGLINTLSTDEVEAILRHELTHLRRNDPLWNAIQELIRTLFFYHPLVHWLCARLDEQREFACDDAVAATTDKTTYANALLRAAKYSLHPKSPFTMAASSPRSFTERIQRLFAPSPELSTRAPRHYLLAPLAILPLLCLFAFTAMPDKEALTRDAVQGGQAVESVLLTGTVTSGETGEPLIGTSIIRVGTDTGTISDLEGNYELRLTPGNHQLSVSYVGYQSLNMEVDIQGNSTVDVVMHKDKPSAAQLGGGGVSVSLVGTPGPTGAEAAMEIMTSGTLKMGGSKNIMYFVDGEKIESGTVNNLDNDSIESVDVLKGEAAIEYGCTADCEGVVLIVTKQ